MSAINQDRTLAAQLSGAFVVFALGQCLVMSVAGPGDSIERATPRALVDAADQALYQSNMPAETESP